MVYSKETEWDVTNPDPQYHYDAILAALKLAKDTLPKVRGNGGPMRSSVQGSTKTWVKVSADLQASVSMGSFAKLYEVVVLAKQMVSKTSLFNTNICSEDFMSFCWRVFFKFFYIQKCRTLHIVTPGGCHWWKCYRNCLRSQRGHLVRYLPQRASRCLQGQGGGHFHPLGQGRLKDIGNDLKGSDHLDRTSFSPTPPPLAGCFVNSLYFFIQPT